MNKAYLDDLQTTIQDHRLNLGFLREQTLLFTGASGLLGRYFIDLLLEYNRLKKAEIKIVAVDLDLAVLKRVFPPRPELLLLAHDVTKPLEFDGKVDYVIHAASPANPYFFAHNPVETIDANYLGTRNLLELSRAKDVKKFVFIASGEVYGQAVCPPGGYREDEAGAVDQMRSRSCYTEGKRAAETLLSAYYDEYQVPALSARLCFVYGPTYAPHESRVFFQFLNSALRGEDLVMKSEGQQVRSYLYVGEAVAALLRLLESGQSGEAYNVASPLGTVSVRQIAETIAAQSAASRVRCELPSDGEKKGYSPYQVAVQDPSKLEALGFSSRLSFEEGVKRTFEVRRSMEVEG